MKERILRTFGRFDLAMVGRWQGPAVLTNIGKHFSTWPKTLRGYVVRRKGGTWSQNVSEGNRL